MRGRAKDEPVMPTSGYWVIRSGSLYIATSWEFFTNPDFTMKGVAHDRKVAIDLFRNGNNYIRKGKPDASEFADYHGVWRR